MNTSKGSFITVTAYLAVLVIVLNLGVSYALMPYLFIAFSFLYVWMAFCVLKDKRDKYPELGPKDE